MSEQKATRPLHKIADEIIKDWRKIDQISLEWVRAMRYLETIEDSYGGDSARGIVGSFLYGAASWRGDTARRVKAELRQIAGLR